MILHLDYETRSEVKIGDKTGVGLHNYVLHPSTRVLMLAYAFGDGEPMLWEPHLGPMPQNLLDWLRNPDVEIMAFNSAFERYVSKFLLNIDLPIARFQDPQASARYLSLPAALEDVGMVLGLPKHLRKDKRGEELLELFSFPKKRKKKELKLNPELSEIYFNDWNTHPKEWVELGEYAKQDVKAEREVARREKLLGAFPLPERERRIWEFDQLVNDRGVPTARVFVEKAFAMAQKNKQEKLEEQNRATGLENANSVDQLLPWVRERGYPLSNLRKQNVELVLNNPEFEMTEECRDVLAARAEAGSTSYTKLQAILRNISPDNRLRGQFIYGGSSRCLRWSGNAVQLHNMARPDDVFEELDNVVKARNYIYNNDYQGLKTGFTTKKGKYYSPLIITKNIIRTAFETAEGKRFDVCDLNAIETRVGAWFAGCEPLLEVFKFKKDPYLDFASKMYGIPYEILWDDYKGKNGRERQIAAKRMRQVAKPGVLGAIYRLSGGDWGKDKNGDLIKTGLWGYAEGMGIDMTREQAHEVVKIFRESYHEIVEMWTTLEKAIMDVMSHERTVRYVGPENCIKIDKITIEGRDPMLRIQLPSGRYLHYMDAAINEIQMPWKKKGPVPVEFDEQGNVTKWEEGEVPVFKPSFTYYGKDQTTGVWSMIVSHGGKTFENIVQAIARDVLADKLLEFEAAGMPVVAHVHDEGVCEVIDDPFSPGVQKMIQIMSRPVQWALSLPLGADGFEDKFYHK